MDPSVRARHSEDRRTQQALYEKDGYVGEGAFGVVIKASLKQIKKQQGTGGTGTGTAASASSAHSDNKCYVAIKQMMNQREGQGIPQDAYREIKMLKELRHTHIVALERIFTRPASHEVDLVYEYADHDLAEIIKVNRSLGSHSDKRFVKSVLQQVLMGLAFLHKNWCMHRDMKPANILVTKGDDPEKGGQVKIADFGLARIFQSPLRKLSDDGEVVTIWYRAPELLLGSKHYTRAIDIFAVGAIFFELITCHPLFPGSEIKGQKIFQENQMKEVCRILGKPTPEIWKGMVDTPYYNQIKSWPAKDYTMTLLNKVGPNISAQGKHLLQSLLTYDPALRITADAALNHPYFKEEPKPDRNVFRDDKPGPPSYTRYPVRPTKPMGSAKRNRESDQAVAAVAANSAAAAAATGISSAVTGSTGLPLGMHMQHPYDPFIQPQQQQLPMSMPMHVSSGYLPPSHPNLMLSGSHHSSSTSSSSQLPSHLQYEHLPPSTFQPPSSQHSGGSDRMNHPHSSFILHSDHAQNFLPNLTFNPNQQQRLSQSASQFNQQQQQQVSHFENDNAFTSGQYNQQQQHPQQLQQQPDDQPNKKQRTNSSDFNLNRQQY